LVLAATLIALPASQVVQAAGTNYYVDAVNGTDDTDIADGRSWATAWRSISYALPRVPGDASDPDIINVAAGTYDGSVEASFPIKINNAGINLMTTANATINGGGADSIIEINAENVTISGFNITSSGAYATNAINATAGGFSILNNTITDVLYGVMFDTDFNLNENGANLVLPDITIRDNNITCLTTGIFFDIDIICDKNSTGHTINVGSIDVSQNQLKAQNCGIEFYGYVEDLNDSTANVGDVFLNHNTISDASDRAIHACTWMFPHADGATAVTCGNLVVNHNTISNSNGIYLEPTQIGYGDNEDTCRAVITTGQVQANDNTINTSYNGNEVGIEIDYSNIGDRQSGSSTTRLGDLQIERNTINSQDHAVEVAYQDCGVNLSGNATLTMGDIYIQDNTALNSALQDSIGMTYIRTGYYLSENARVTIGQTHILNNSISARGNGIYQYFDDFVFDISDNTALVMDDIFVTDNKITSSLGNGLDIGYASYDVAYTTQNNTSAVLPDWNITGNEFNTSLHCIYFYSSDNPYYTYGTSTINFSGFLIDRNTFNSPDEGVYLDYSALADATQDNSVCNLNDISITNNTFNMAGSDGIYLNFYILGEDVEGYSHVNVGNLTVTDNQIYGSNNGIFIDYASSLDIDTIGRVDIGRNTISNAAGDGIYINIAAESVDPPGAFPSPTHAWYSHDTPLEDATLTFSADLAGTTSPQLTFQHWYYTEVDYDGGWVEISTDGNTWTQLTPQGGYPAQAVDPNDPEYSMIAAYGDISGGWLTATFDLSAYAGQNVSLRFRYFTDYSNHYFGWLVDDIKVFDNIPGGAVILFNNVESGAGTWTEASENPNNPTTWSIVTDIDHQVLPTPHIFENNISNCGNNGMYVQGAKGVAINRNIVSGNLTCIDGIHLDGVNGAAVTNNLIEKNAHGLYLSDCENIDISHNDILLNYYVEHSGIHLDSETGPGIAIHYNNFYNRDFGVFNENTVTANATDNWWGDPAGPGGEFNDRVSAYVETYPWLTAQSLVNIYEQATTATGTGTAEIQTANGVVADFKAVPETDLPTDGKPAGLSFPQGFFSFKILGLDEEFAQTVQVTVTLPQAVPMGTKWVKCHDGVYYVLSIGDDDGDNVITIELTDQVIGEDDFLDYLDGAIWDDGGPGYPVADLEVTKTDSPDPVTAGSNITYTVTVTNHGPDTAAYVTANDTIPANTTFVSSTPAPGIYTSSNGTWEIGSLSANATATLTLVVKVNNGFSGTITNTATVSSNESDDLIPTNNLATATTRANAETTPVVKSIGGEVEAISRWEVLWPWIGLIAAVLTIGTLYWWRRARR
jgi:uncharacterized repeat protein (TIGR01451 family)